VEKTVIFRYFPLHQIFVYIHSVINYHSVILFSGSKAVLKLAGAFGRRIKELYRIFVGKVSERIDQIDKRYDS
jgi:hypothetical protein